MDATLLEQQQTASDPNFVDRRDPNRAESPAGFERRQFANSYDDLSPDAAELANAIDQYKLLHRRRFINHEEMLGVIKSLGYSK
ncbi:MAG: hypothetical protein CMJ58_14640 [Planctomycetaceae bacterium]|nr:hypothetical protein [Planctomycetaceae bacterium]